MTTTEIPVRTSIDMCWSCEQRPRLPDDTLCARCRREIDRIYGGLPGAKA